jgi:hypothetical protein
MLGTSYPSNFDQIQKMSHAKVAKGERTLLFLRKIKKSSIPFSLRVLCELCVKKPLIQGVSGTARGTRLSGVSWITARGSSSGVF